ncbi:MAG: sigma-70 family RNA polymerase sigma factor [Planctomycetaceae bacterium]|jgi:RNA polymerase sigma-70 factor (ECF subfamily)|nr:sigma-70 family RNA polymerase sigma factor [Planctomycetaceae bacterium]
MPLPVERFQELAEQFASPLTLYARQFFADNDFHRGEDAVQNVLFRLSQQPKEPENAAAWLYKAVRNEAILASRSETRRKRREAGTENGKFPFFQLLPDNQLDAVEVADALQKLEPDEREIITLHIWGGLPFAEIAEVAGVPQTTAYRKYKESLEKLKQWMS